MPLIFISFIAGILTVAAPCVLPLLPIIIGGSLVDGIGKDGKPKKASPWRPVVIAAALAVSVILFTFLLKVTTALLGVSTVVWQVISGAIVIILGSYYLWPKWWEVLSARFGLFTGSNVLLGKSLHERGWVGAVFTGAALGPVFSSCSPTYALIVAVVIPANFIQGFVYLISYALGMSLVLLLIALLGQAFVAKLRWLSNPTGWFVRVIGILFIATGLMVTFGFDKKLQTYVLDRGWYDPISDIETRIR